MKSEINKVLRRKLEIVAVGVTVIVLVFLFTRFSPTARRVSLLKKQVGEMDEKIKSLRESIQIEDEERINEIKELISRYYELKKLYNSSGGSVPSEPDLSGFIDQLLDVGKRSGVEFVRITSNALKDYKFYREVPLEVEVKGSFNEIEGFMRGVENMRRLLKISVFRLESDEKKPPVISAEFLIRCCIRGDEGER